MAFKTIKQNIKKIVELLEVYAKNNIDYYKLKFLKRIAKASGKVYRLLVLFLLLPLVLFFGSIAAAICIGNHFNNYAIGFAIVGAAYFVIMLIALLLGGVFFKRPLIRRLAKKMFKEKE